MLTFLDSIILVFCFFIAMTFIFLGTEKVYKFYVGLTFGFLIFLVLNLQISVLELEGQIAGFGNSIPKPLWKDFLIENKDFVLFTGYLLVPILGILFTIFSKPLDNKKISTMVMGFFLPIFALAILAFIGKNIVYKLGLSEFIVSALYSSTIFQFFNTNPHYIFFLIFLLIFGKFIYIIIFGFVTYIVEIVRLKFGKDEDEDE